ATRGVGIVSRGAGRCAHGFAALCRADSRVYGLRARFSAVGDVGTTNVWRREFADVGGFRLERTLASGAGGYGCPGGVVGWRIICGLRGVIGGVVHGDSSVRIAEQPVP